MIYSREVPKRVIDGRNALIKIYDKVADVTIPVLYEYRNRITDDIEFGIKEPMSCVNSAMELLSSSRTLLNVGEHLRYISVRKRDSKIVSLDRVIEVLDDEQLANVLKETKVAIYNDNEVMIIKERRFQGGKNDKC